MFKKLVTLTIILFASGAYASDLAVTIYNSNVGVVSEKRTLSFDQGIGQIKITDIPSSIDATSVRFSVPNNSVSILEQNYVYDLVNSDKVISRYIDKEIELINKDGSLINGTLLNFDRSAFTILTENGIKIAFRDNLTEVNFPKLPEGLITKPTLIWDYSSNKKDDYEGTLSYQAGGMRWTAEYVGILNDEETNLDLNGWASITNNSGMTYKNATLKLIAGDINDASQKGRGHQVEVMAMSAMAKEADGFEEKAFFEYHMYTLPRKATLNNMENKQISLFDPSSTGVVKKFIYRPDRDAKKVEVALSFKNSKDNGLGMPLPKGRIRIFKADTDESLILLGADVIDHTPKDEDLNLTIGNAFDITAEQKILSQNRISKEVEEQEFEITINNRKDEDISLEVEKKLYRFWEIVSSDIEYNKKDASTLIFKPSVKANETMTFKFKVRYTYR